MSSASAGSTSDNSGDKNFAQSGLKPCPTCGSSKGFSATSAVAAEAEQGDGPAAASASSAAVCEAVVQTSAVSVCVGADYAAAACDFGAVVVGPSTAAAVGKTGAVAVGPAGAAASPFEESQVDSAQVADGAVDTEDASIRAPAGSKRPRRPGVRGT